MRQVITVFIAVGFLLIGFQLYAADIFLETSKRRPGKMNIGIIPFSGLSQGVSSTPRPHEGSNPPPRSHEIDMPLIAESILKTDLIRSQRFNVIEFVGNDDHHLDLTYPPGKKLIAWAKQSGVLAIAWAKLYPSSASGSWRPTLMRRAMEIR